jgi:hypothetical protein
MISSARRRVVFIPFKSDINDFFNITNNPIQITKIRTKKYLFDCLSEYSKLY